MTAHETDVFEVHIFQTCIIDIVVYVKVSVVIGF